MLLNSQNFAIANAHPIAAEDIEGYHPQEELARHMIFDGAPTEWAADVLGIPTMDWMSEDHTQISDCGSYTLIEDSNFGVNTLLFNGDVLVEDLPIRRLDLYARVHRFQHSQLS